MRCKILSRLAPCKKFDKQHKKSYYYSARNEKYFFSAGRKVICIYINYTIYVYIDLSWGPGNKSEKKKRG